MSETDGGIDLLRGVRNVRQYRSDPVPEDALDAILQAARWSGSAMNRQPWEFVVVRDPATIRALTAIHQNVGWIASAPLAIVVVMAGQNAAQEGYDEGRVTERILLAARAKGLGAGLGWFQPGAPQAAAKALLGVPEGRGLRTIVAVGYPDAGDNGTPKRGPARKPLAELVHVDRYGERAT